MLIGEHRIVKKRRWIDIELDHAKVMINVLVIGIGDDGGMSHWVHFCFVYLWIERGYIYMLDFLSHCFIYLMIQAQRIRSTTKEQISGGWGDLPICRKPVTVLGRGWAWLCDPSHIPTWSAVMGIGAFIFYSVFNCPFTVLLLLFLWNPTQYITIIYWSINYTIINETLYFLLIYFSSRLSNQFVSIKVFHASWNHCLKAQMQRSFTRILNVEVVCRE